MAVVVIAVAVVVTVVVMVVAVVVVVGVVGSEEENSPSVYQVRSLATALRPLPITKPTDHGANSAQPD